jgi:hypothetical protein
MEDLRWELVAVENAFFAVGFSTDGDKPRTNWKANSSWLPGLNEKIGNLKLKT